MQPSGNGLPWIYFAPHFGPLLVYFVVRSCAGFLPADHGAYWAYILTIPAVGATLLFFRKEYTELTWKSLTPLDLLLAAGTGILGIAIWILPYHFAPHTMQDLGLSNLLAKLGLASGSVDNVMNPDQLEGGFRLLFISARIFGAVILIPFAEELFHRSGALRLIIRSEFRSEPIGRFTAASFGIGLALFAFSHEEWIVATVWGAMICALLYRTKRLETCILAHALSNLILAVYVLQQSAWNLW